LPPQYFYPGFKSGEVALTDAGDSAVQAAARSVHDATHGARVVIRAAAPALSIHEKRLTMDRAAATAKDLVGFGVYPGAITILWSAEHHHRGVTIEVLTFADGF
jgi:hypothetical protein